MKKRKRKRSRKSGEKGLLDPKTHLPRIYDLMYSAWGPQHWWPGDTPFEVMVGAILTQNCSWSNVEKAIANLKAADLMTADALHAADLETVAQLIRPTGYFNIKAKRLRNFLDFFMHETEGREERFKGIPTPMLRQRLLTVNGLGCETVDSILLYALDRTVFVIDAYTRRIMKRHNLIAGNEDYDDIRALFETNLPRRRKLYNEYHALIVHAGKDHCRPTPKCEDCPLRDHPHDPGL